MRAGFEAAIAGDSRFPPGTVLQCYRCKKFKFRDKIVETLYSDSGEPIRFCLQCFNQSRTEARVAIGARYEVDKETVVKIRKVYERTWNNSFFGAKQKEHCVTFENVISIWADQKGICALSGKRMNFTTNSMFVASLDRINSEKGYLADNIQWVCWAANMMKSDMTTKQLRYWATSISNHLK